MNQEGVEQERIPCTRCGSEGEVNAGPTNMVFPCPRCHGSGIEQGKKWCPTCRSDVQGNICQGHPEGFPDQGLAPCVGCEGCCPDPFHNPAKGEGDAGEMWLSCECLWQPWPNGAFTQHPSPDCPVHRASPSESQPVQGEKVCERCGGNGRRWGGSSCLRCHGSGVEPTPDPPSVQGEGGEDWRLDIDVCEKKVREQMVLAREAIEDRDGTKLAWCGVAIDEAFDELRNPASIVPNEGEAESLEDEWTYSEESVSPHPMCCQSCREAASENIALREELTLARHDALRLGREEVTARSELTTLKQVIEDHAEEALEEAARSPETDAMRSFLDRFYQGQIPSKLSDLLDGEGKA